MSYRSKYEARIAKKCKKKFTYESISVEWQPPTKKYTPDFIFTKRNGEIMAIEAKGRFTTADRTKMKCVKQQHPDLDIRLLFQNPRVKLSKKSKTDYGTWATRHGFKWAEGETLPASWLKEIQG